MRPVALLVALFLTCSVVNAYEDVYDDENDETERKYALFRKYYQSPKHFFKSYQQPDPLNCPVMEPWFRRLLESICIHCHELLSHVNPNARYLCRRNCFRTGFFMTCLTSIPIHISPNQLSLIQNFVNGES